MVDEMIITIDNKREILWNIINALILGSAVFFGAFLDGGISRADLIASLGASAILFLSKFGEYWKAEEKEYSKSSFALFL